MNNGWIKLHRRMTEWEWYTDIPTKVSLLHLILICNHEEKKWRGITIKRGETVQSLETLAKNSGISVMQWRTAINNLKSTQSITERKHGKFRILKLEKYIDYQINNTIINNEVTRKQQGDNSKQEGKNIRTKEERTSGADAPTPPTAEEDKRMALLLSAGLRRTNPAYAQKFPSDLECSAKLDAWVKDFEKMRRIDKATEEQISFVIHWLFEGTGRDSIFWRSNIQSGSKLREQFARLVGIIKSEKQMQQNKVKVRIIS